MDREFAYKAIDKLNSKEKRIFFFKKINTPNWIPHLLDKGYLKHAPEPEVSDENEIHPFWIESAYLLRMSSKDDLKENDIDLIESALVQIDHKNNFYVLGHLLEIYRNIGLTPDSIFFKSLDQAIQKTTYTYIPGYLTEDIIQLYKLQSENIDPAVILPIIELLLEYKVIEKDVWGSNLIEIQPSKLDSWEYEQIVNNILVDLAGRDKSIFKLMLNKLNDMLRIKHDIDYPKDSTFIRLQDFDNPKHVSDPDEILILGIIKSAWLKPIEYFDLMNSFDHQWNTIVRIQMYILNKNYEEIGEENFLKLDLDYLTEQIGVWFEYSHFLKNHFGKLSPELQNKIIQSRIEYSSKRADKSELLRFYQVIEDFLSGEHKEAYDLIIKERGKISQPHQHISIGTTWVGPTAPVKLEDLSKKNVNEVIQYLIEWKPEAGFMGATPEGMARLLEEDVKQRIDLYLSEAQNLYGLHPTYVRAIISAAENQSNNVGKLDHLIGLCNWIVNQQDESVEIFEGIDPFDADQSWSLTRKRVASLLEKLLEKNRFKENQKELILEIIQNLLGDSEPTLKYEEEYGGQNMDPFTMSINTVRGQAMHAFFRFLEWLKNTGQNYEEPKYIHLLDHHLNNDQTLTSRSVFGCYFPFLDFLIPDWTEVNAQTIFPEEKSKRAYFNAALKGLAYRSHVENLMGKYDFLFDLIIESLKETNPMDWSFNPQFYATLAWRGLLFKQIGFDEHSYARKLIEINNRDINRIFVASFRSINEQNPKALNQKESTLKEIWTYFIENEPQLINDGSTPPGRTVLSQFGYWFASKEVFDDKEKLNLYHQTVIKNPFSYDVESVYSELERLSHMSEHLQKIGEILKDFKPLRWDIYSPKRTEMTKNILRLLAAKPDTEGLSKDIRKTLIEKGYDQFVKI